MSEKIMKGGYEMRECDSLANRYKNLVHHQKLNIQLVRVVEKNKKKNLIDFTAFLTSLNLKGISVLNVIGLIINLWLINI